MFQFHASAMLEELERLAAEVVRAQGLLEVILRVYPLLVSTPAA